MLKINIIVLFVFISSQLMALDINSIKWKLVHNRDQIKIYQGEKKSEGIIPLKSEAVIKFPRSRILAILNNTNAKKQWLPQAEETRLLKQIGPREKIEYLRYGAPLFFSDRVFVILTKGHFDEATDRIIVDIKSIDTPLAPRNKDYVRGNTSYGYLSLQAINGGKETKLEMSFITDLGGSIPNWATNFIQKKWPLKFFRSLNKRLNQKDLKVPKEFILGSEKKLPLQS